MTNYNYATSLAVTLNGADITDRVLSADITLGLLKQVSEAKVEVYELPAGATYWQPLTVTCGYSGGNVVKRFDGYLAAFPKRNWLPTVTLQAKGPLLYAERVLAQDDDTTGQAGEGVDLSNAGAGQTDGAMVTQVLTACGLAGRLGTIGGTARVLGTQATSLYTWRRTESGLAIIKQLDKISLGFRTYEQLGGTIVRTLVSPRCPVA